MGRLRDYYKKPRTTQERRMASRDATLVRAKRNQLNIPSLWDDLPRCNTRSWKAHRRTQYRN